MSTGVQRVDEFPLQVVARQVEPVDVLLAAFPYREHPEHDWNPGLAVENRAHDAARAVVEYARHTGTTDESPRLVICDLLADLMHLLDGVEDDGQDGYSGDLFALADRAYRRYEEEIRGDI